MGLIKTISDAALKIQRILAISCSLFIIFGVCSGAFFRYVLGVSFHGLEELLIIGSFWMYFIGASYASYDGKHITAEVFSIYCKIPTLRYSVAVLADLITFSLAALYTVWAWGFFMWSIEAGGLSTRLQIPLAVGHSAVFFGFAMMSCYFFVDLLKQIKNLRESRNSPTGKPHDTSSV